MVTQLGGTMTIEINRGCRGHESYRPVPCGGDGTDHPIVSVFAPILTAKSTALC
jgi:hypothetical protein